MGDTAVKAVKAVKAVQAVQIGGSRIGQEARSMSSYFIVIFLALVIVYIPRIPDIWLKRFRSPLWQFIAIVLLFGITELYGWVHGILGALAFALLLSHTNLSRHTESFDDYIIDTNLGKPSKRWFSEKVMDEHPFLIRENAISTVAVQDLSERNMGSSYSSPSSK